MSLQPDPAIYPAGAPPLVTWNWPAVGIGAAGLYLAGEVVTALALPPSSWGVGVLQLLILQFVLPVAICGLMIVLAPAQVRAKGYSLFWFAPFALVTLVLGLTDEFLWYLPRFDTWLPWHAAIAAALPAVVLGGWLTLRGRRAVAYLAVPVTFAIGFGLRAPVASPSVSRALYKALVLGPLPFWLQVFVLSLTYTVLPIVVGAWLAGVYSRVQKSNP